MIKQLAAALCAGSLALLSLGSVAAAYPPFERIVTLDKSTVAPGEIVTATANCAGLEEVTIDLAGTTAVSVCNGADDEGATSAALLTSGTASAAVAAPAVPGDFIVTVTGSFSGDLGSAQVAVVEQTATTVASPSPTDVLPETGSEGVGLTAGVALAVLALGVGLFALATLRRRQPIID